MRATAKALNFPVSLTIAVSRYNRDAITAAGITFADRLHLVYNGVDLARCDAGGPSAAFRTRHQIPPSRILITQIAQLRPEKGVPDLLEALSLALPRNPALHLAFVGDGEHQRDFERLANDLGIPDHVTWAGLDTDPFAGGAYAATDIACLASRWEEAFGFVIAEAMSCRKPVVATHAGAIPELVIHGETGFIVPRRDPPALAEKILSLAADPELRLRFGLAGYRRAAALFDVHANARQLLGLYALPQRPGKPPQ